LGALETGAGQSDHDYREVMKVKKLYDEGGLRTFAVVMDVGDDGVERLVSFARDQAVKAASVTAVGACRDATIAYFDPDIKDYRSARIEGQMELLSVMGDIATKDGDPALHVHAVLGRPDFSTIGGHLQHITVFPTMEVIVTETPGHLVKRIDDVTGLALIAVDADDVPRER
jgi:predicted DNA-binding protein with PD1-like motif